MKYFVTCSLFLLLHIGLIWTKRIPSAPIIPPGDKHFVILILSHNNERFCEATMASALCQDYPHYRIVFCNDASTDRTEELVHRKIKQAGKEDLVTIITNKKRKGAMYNHYHMVHHFIKEHEIVVVLDGDGDELAGPGVLSHLNDVYHDGTIWMTFGSFRGKYHGQRGCAAPVDEKIAAKNSFRKQQQIFGLSHLRSYYAWLFKHINSKDFMLEGNFFTMGCDVATMIPMIEMASRGHFAYIHDILYIYNDRNPLSDAKVDWRIQRRVNDYVRNLPAYKPL